MKFNDFRVNAYEIIISDLYPNFHPLPLLLKGSITFPEKIFIIDKLQEIDKVY